MKINFICIGIFYTIATATSTGCPSTEISFAKKQGQCYDYESGSVSHSTPIVKDPYMINHFTDNLLPFCTTVVCGDGRHHLFCTTSGTSDGDCIAGDAVENFERIYAGKVDGVAIKLNALAVVPALVNELVHEFTTEDRSIKIYEDGNQKGESLTMKSKIGQCINLPTEWQMRVSSYGAKNQARFYTGENCTGHSVVACRDFVQNDFWAKSNNLWGLLCSTDRMNDNTRSFKFE